jgi:hypothetical protein
MITLVVIGFLYVVLVWVLDSAGIIFKAKNVITKSAISKVVLSIEGYMSSYNKVPNEVDFIDVLRVSSESLDEKSCTQFGLPDYECIFKIKFVSMPKLCDLSHWRNDSLKNKERDKDCYIRYYAGQNLPSNSNTNQTHFRIYSPVWYKDFMYYVYDSAASDYFLCPNTIVDSDSVFSVCKVL